MPLAKGADATLQLGDEVAMTLDGPTYKVTLVVAGETAAADDGGLVRALFQERARSSKTVAAMRTEAYERGLRRGLAREGE